MTGLTALYAGLVELGVIELEHQELACDMTDITNPVIAAGNSAEADELRLDMPPRWGCNSITAPI